MTIEPPSRTQIYGWIAWLLVISAPIQLLIGRPWVAGGFVVFAVIIFVLLAKWKRIEKLGPPPGPIKP